MIRIQYSHHKTCLLHHKSGGSLVDNALDYQSRDGRFQGWQVRFPASLVFHMELQTEAQSQYDLC